MLAADDIVGLWKERQKAQSPLFARMRKVRDQYNASWVTPLDEIDREVQVSVANLLLQGIDQLARRVSSILPTPDYHPVRPGVEADEKRARIRTMATVGWWEANRMGLKLRTRARHLLAYATTGVIVLPSFRGLRGASNGGPRWRVLDPLNTFPSPRNELDAIVPDDVIARVQHPVSWLAAEHPEALRYVSRDASPDTLLDVLLYASAEQISLVLVGHSRSSTGAAVPHGVMLENVPNRAGRPLAVVPNLLGLDMPRTSYESMVGLARQRARLDALTLLAIERGIYPEVWLVANPNEVPKIEEEADGPLGIIGRVSGGKLETIQIQPAYRTEMAIDRLERQERLEGGIPAEFGGESPTNVRTGRRGESILSTMLDPRVQECQEIFAESLVEEDCIAIAIEKGWWGSESRSFFFGGLTKRAGTVDYVPNRDFDSDRHVVTFPVSGGDVNYLRVGVGQLLGLGLISQDSARRLDPMIRDPEEEKDRITAEALESAVMSALQQQVADPNSPLSVVDIAWMARKVKSNEMELFEAIEEMQKRAQQRQAVAVPPDVPQAQPGIVPPGMGAEQPVAEPRGRPSIADILATLRG